MDKRSTVKLTRPEMCLVGVAGIPYYLVAVLSIFQLSQVSSWFWLLVIPAFAIYDWTSQLSYLKWVRSCRIGKARYVVASLVIQTLFIAAIFGTAHGAKYVLST